MLFNEKKITYEAEKKFLENECIKNLIESNVITETQARGHLFLYYKAKLDKSVKTDNVAFVLMQVLKNENEEKKHNANLSPIYREYARFYCGRNRSKFTTFFKLSSKAQLDFFDEQNVKEVSVIFTSNSCNNCKETFYKGDEITIERAIKEKVLPYENCEKKCNNYQFFNNEKFCTCEYYSKKVNKNDFRSPDLDDDSLFTKICSSKKIYLDANLLKKLKEYLRRRNTKC